MLLQALVGIRDAEHNSKNIQQRVFANVLDQQVAQSGMWPTPPKRVNSISSHQPWPHNNVLKLLREKVGSFLQLVRFN
jgi:hypothetical protein